MGPLWSLYHIPRSGPCCTPLLPPSLLCHISEAFIQGVLGKSGSRPPLHSGTSSDPRGSEASGCQASSVHLQLQGSCPSQRFLLHWLCLPPRWWVLISQPPLGWGCCRKSLLPIQKLHRLCRAAGWGLSACCPRQRGEPSLNGESCPLEVCRGFSFSEEAAVPPGRGVSRGLRGLPP